MRRVETMPAVASAWMRASVTAASARWRAHRAAPATSIVMAAQRLLQIVIGSSRAMRWRSPS